MVFAFNNVQRIYIIIRYKNTIYYKYINKSLKKIFSAENVIVMHMYNNLNIVTKKIELKYSTIKILKNKFHTMKKFTIHKSQKEKNNRKIFK
jgi:hypothetical protein